MNPEDRIQTTTVMDIGTVSGVCVTEQPPPFRIARFPDGRERLQFRHWHVVQRGPWMVQEEKWINVPVVEVEFL